MVGSTGSTGSTGYTGSSGLDGLVGLMGSTGSTGPTGSTGSTGSTGYTGSSGAIILPTTNNWTGINTFDIILPTSLILPTTNTQLSNKLYVDNSIITAKTNLLSSNNIFTGTNTFNVDLNMVGNLLLTGNVILGQNTTKNFVLTFVPKRTATGDALYRNVISVSSTGKYIAFVANNSIYNSIDYGKTFILTTTGDAMAAIAINLSGQYQIAISINTPTQINSNIYVSTNYGVTWILRKLAAANNIGRYVEGCSIDSTGQYMMANGGGSAGLQQNISIDFGTTFIIKVAIDLTIVSTILNNKQVFYNPSATLASFLMTDSTFTNITVTQPFAVSAITSYDNKLVLLNLNGLSYAYSIDNGITFVTVTTPVTGIKYIKCNSSGIWLSSDTTIFLTTDNGITYRSFVQPSTIRSFAPAQNDSLFVLFENGNLFCQQITIPPGNFGYLSDVTSSIQEQLNALTIKNSFSSINCSGLLSVNSFKTTKTIEAFLSASFSTTMTFNFDLGMIYSLNITTLTSSSVLFTNIPITSQQSYNFTFVITPTVNSKFYIIPTNNLISINGVATIPIYGISNISLPATFTYLIQQITIINTSITTTPTYIALTNVSAF